MLRRLARLCSVARYGLASTFPNEHNLIHSRALRVALNGPGIETIHPFCDGDGRTGRLIAILYLIAKGLLDIPVLHLRCRVILAKFEFCRLLQQTRDTGD